MNKLILKLSYFTNSKHSALLTIYMCLTFSVEVLYEIFVFRISTNLNTVCN